MRMYRTPDHQEEPVLREAARLGEIFTEDGTVRDWLARTCVDHGWLTAHGRHPNRYIITPAGLEVIR